MQKSQVKANKVYLLKILKRISSTLTLASKSTLVNADYTLLEESKREIAQLTSIFGKGLEILSFALRKIDSQQKILEEKLSAEFSEVFVKESDYNIEIFISKYKSPENYFENLISNYRVAVLNAFKVNLIGNPLNGGDQYSLETLEKIPYEESNLAMGINRLVVEIDHILDKVNIMISLHKSAK